jgi:hypothetical protein
MVCVCVCVLDSEGGGRCGIALFSAVLPFFSSVWNVLGIKTYARSVRSLNPVIIFCLDQFSDPGGLKYPNKSQRTTVNGRSTVNGR